MNIQILKLALKINNLSEYFFFKNWTWKLSRIMKLVINFDK